VIAEKKHNVKTKTVAVDFTAGPEIFDVIREQLEDLEIGVLGKMFSHCNRHCCSICMCGQLYIFNDNALAKPEANYCKRNQYFKSQTFVLLILIFI